MFGTHVSDRDFILKLSVEVITRKPAGKEWKAVAYNMNQYLFDEGLWYTPYYFYCGRKCRYFFRNIIIKESAGTHSSSSTNEAENTQSAAPATETSNGAAEPRSIEPVPILKRYMLKARQVEEEAQLEYWRKQYPDANLP
ncbi:DUP/COS family protein SKDI_01G0860 [Saccharomyces kudriavzevii IFO 1802]|nr:uncharacterized protein SKDI_01G0860 [Saccharomyces kudriavzevii IFO 1802]CAI4054664.1 hypothetical protein SKDI_01G0860 [Saccharomyces kudriavzevii IFO 1802]